MNRALPARPLPAGLQRLPAGAALRSAAWIERNAPRLLAGLLALYVLGFSLAWIYKYAHFGQGYDQVDFEQAIWNTTQGRPFADSRFSFTDSVFGLDWMPLLGLFVPVYALLPGAQALAVLQVIGTALGAVPIYRLAKVKLGTARHGLVFGLAWLLYPTVQYSVMDPFQIRLFAVTALLWALYFFETDRLGPFLLCTGIAVLARTDVALVALMFGIYAALARRGVRWTVAPLLLGGGYFLVVMTLIVPAFVHLPPVLCSGPVPPDQMDRAWPGSSNPNLGYYLHWGCTPTMIVTNLVKDPLYTLRYMLGDGHKWGYMAALLAPFALLSLLAPVRLLLAAPILGMNLIAWRGAQTDWRNHYGLLITVGVVAAAIAGYARLEALILRWRSLRPDLEVTPAGLQPRPAPTAADVVAETRRMIAWREGPLLALIAIALLVNGGLQLLSDRLVVSRGESAARVAAAERLIALVPPAASVAASSFLAPHLLPRRDIYNFPPAPYSPYTLADAARPSYILLDPRAQALADPAGQTALRQLRTNPTWTLIRADQGFQLYGRTP